MPLKNGQRSEADEQKILFEWAAYLSELENMYAIPNGGKRNVREAADLKRQGVRSGVPDICLALPKGKYHGLYIELKVGRNKPSENQKEWLGKLSKVGYATAVCYGFEEAQKVILDYINLPAKEQ